MNNCEINGHSSEEVLNKFKEIIRDTKILNKEQIELKHAVFKQIFPKLYEMALNNEGEKSIKTLEMMLGVKKKQNKGELNIFQSNLVVGEELGKQYIYNKVGHNPSKEDYERAIRLLEKQNNQ
jgi:hypothetical protein